MTPGSLYSSVSAGETPGEAGGRRRMLLLHDDPLVAAFAGEHGGGDAGGAKMSSSPASIFSARHTDVHMKQSMSVNGRPATMETARTAPSASPSALSPTTSSAMARQPSVQHQKIFCTMGGLARPLAEMTSSTYDPESEEVMKYSVMPTSRIVHRNFLTSP